MIAGVALFALLQAPADRPCTVVIDSIGGDYVQRVTAAGDTNRFAGRGVLAHCEGTSSTLSADSVAIYGRERRLDFVGRVQIRDTALALDAHRASYYLRDERLEAHNNVVAVNRRNGSVLRGPNLKYWRASAGLRDTAEMYATTRPTVEYRQPGDSGEPYVVVGDRIRVRGDERIWAGGKVTVDRSDFASRSDSLLLDETQGLGVLVGRPRVEGRSGKTYTLEGTRIELGLEGRELRLVKALGRGRAAGDDWTLTADTIHLQVRDRALQQALAWGNGQRPNAVATLYTIQADSLAIDTPGEVLTETRAFGRAFSTARRDSTVATADIDWIAGDSLVARFAQEADSTGRERSRLRQLVARGSARALTHHPNEADTSAAPAINYSRGRQIAVALKGDRIDRVVVAGRADGLHLEAPPTAPPPPPPPADTARPRP